MMINDKKLKKYLNDVGLINEIEEKLKYYIYFVDYVGNYTPYINGSGMDYDTRYTYDVEKVIKYCDKEIYCVRETETFREEEGYTPDKFSEGSIICSYGTNLNDNNLNELYTKEKLNNAIISDYNITDEVIDNYYNNNESLPKSENNTNEEDTDDKLFKLYKEIDAIDYKINDKKSIIESLQKAINFLEMEKSRINQEIEQKINSKRK